jgi:UDP-N-acetylmuramoyl-tripeptide--D-alanyl-D-alanine ligase
LPEEKRLIKYQGFEGAIIIDDTYNANPLSVQAALETLAQMSSDEKIFVFGDMAELGASGKELHKQIGEYARTLGIQKLFTYGKLSQITANTFGKNAYHFEDQMELIKALQKILKSGTAVLIKGSRSFRMEKIVQALI